MIVKQIHLDQKCAKDSSLLCFVETGNSADAPLVSLVGNNGFPEVQAVYAWPILHQALHGVQIVVRLTAAAQGQELVVALAQATMPGPLTVTPLI